MKNFYKVTDVNVKDVMDSLNAHPELWGHRLPIRTAFPNSPQREADDIIFRFNDLSQHVTQDTLPQIFDDIKCVWFPPVLVMPIINVLSLFIMQAVHGEELGRVMITKLPPGGVIHPHVDEGGYADYYDRFHLCLSSGDHNVFQAGDEIITMNPGELYWFNRKAEHSVSNDDDVDRIHLIIDCRIFYARNVAVQRIPQ